MKCEEAQELLIEYADNMLPEVTRRRVDHHLAACPSCRSEFDVWTESGRWIQADKEQVPQLRAPRSIVDAVMTRIMSEEKWAIPIGKRLFTVTARMRWFGLSAAAALLLICSFAVYSNSKADLGLAQSVAVHKRGVVKATLEPIEPAAAPTSAQPALEGFLAPSDHADAGHGEEAALQSIVPEDRVESVKPNTSLILGFFGILLTVLGMSWFTRA